MVPLRGNWTPFADLNDQLEHYRQWGLIPPKSKKLRPVMVVDGYFGIPEPCEVVGYQGDNWAVITLQDGLHAIHGEYLADLQPNAYQRLPYGMYFADVLRKYVVIDIETTGFDRIRGRVIEIAAATYEYGGKVSEFHSMVDTGMLIPEQVASLLGITQEDVEDAPSIEVVEECFRDYIGDLPLVGHNAASFDVPFLSAQFSAPIENPVIDTLYMAQKVFYLLNCHKLQYLKDVLKLGSSGNHRALNDVEATNSLLWACLAPQKYESLVNKELIDNRLSGKSKKQEKLLFPQWLENSSACGEAEKRNSIHSIHEDYLEELHPDENQNSESCMYHAKVPSKYVVFDIETTGLNRKRDGVIEIAAATYECGSKISEYQSFVNPGMIIPKEIVSLTGITQADVAGAPSIEEIEKSFLEYIGDLPLVGHNAASFDVPFLSAQFSVPIKNPIIDTLCMSKNVFRILPCHKLPYLSDVLMLGSAGAHRALNDVETTNSLLLACHDPRKYQSLINKALVDNRPSRTNEEQKKRSLPGRRKNDLVPENSKRFEKVDIKSIVPTCSYADTSSPLCGKTIVFTGTLSIPRGKAMQLAVDAGAILRASVSAKTEYLVVGSQDIAIVGMDGMSDKEEKAHALNNSGKANIKIISEREFLDLVKKEGVTV